MGCSSSKVSYEPADETSVSTSRHWRVAQTENSLKAQFTSDGTITGGSQTTEVELRSLLNYPVAVECIHSYALSQFPQYERYIHAWVDMQTFKDMSECDAKKNLADQIDRKFIRGSTLVLDTDQDLITSKLEVYDPKIGLTGLFDEVQNRFFHRLHEDIFCPFKMSPEYKKMNTALRRKYNRVKCNDFEYFDVLGEGGFGMVCSVRKKSTGVRYAMKVQRKEQLYAMFGDEPWRADFEKQAFASCKHPFIVELSFAFQTRSLVMLVMTLGTGQDLAKILKHGGALSYNHVRFYAAEITSALSYLHHKSFLYRDLKPGNVLLNADGHIQLVDFGAVCDLNGKTLGVCQDPGAMQAVFAKQRGHRDTALPMSEFWARQSPPGSPTARSSGASFDCNPDTTLNFVDGVSTYGYDKTSDQSHTRTENPAKLSSESVHVTARDNQSSDDKSERANSFIGTYSYMAPEMVMMMMKQGGWEVSGYTKAVDWWSLGVTMYKLLTGQYPFETRFVDLPEDAASDTRLEHGLARYGALLEEVDYSGLSLFPAAVSCISGLLTVEETKRLGYGADGWQNLSSHPFFDTIDWVALEHKQVVPPPLPLGFTELRCNTPYECMQHVLVAHGKGHWIRPAAGTGGTCASISGGGAGAGTARSSNGAGTAAAAAAAAAAAVENEKEKQYLKAMNMQFEGWDYTAPAAVLAELSVPAAAGVGGSGSRSRSGTLSGAAAAAGAPGETCVA